MGEECDLRNIFLTKMMISLTILKMTLESRLNLHPTRFLLKISSRVILNSEVRKCKFNVFKEEGEAIIGLRKNKNIVIFEADNGGAVVIMNKQDYVTEALKRIDSKDANGDDIYQKLLFDCTQKFVREVQQSVDLAFSNNVIDETMAEMLAINDAKPGNIYFLPKIHKDINPPPGRPICNTINTPRMNLSKCVDLIQL